MWYSYVRLVCNWKSTDSRKQHHFTLYEFTCLTFRDTTTSWPAGGHVQPHRPRCGVVLVNAALPAKQLPAARGWLRPAGRRHPTSRLDDRGRSRVAGSPLVPEGSRAPLGGQSNVDAAVVIAEGHRPPHGPALPSGVGCGSERHRSSTVVPERDRARGGSSRGDQVEVPALGPFLRASWSCEPLGAALLASTYKAPGCVWEGGEAKQSSSESGRVGVLFWPHTKLLCTVACICCPGRVRTRETFNLTPTLTQHVFLSPECVPRQNGTYYARVCRKFHKHFLAL